MKFKELDMDREYALNLIKQNGNLVRMVPAELIDDDFRMTCIQRTPTSIQYFPNPTVDEQMMAIQTQGEIDRDGIFDLVDMIPDIDQKVLDSTLDINGNCLKMITEPTYEQMTRAVTRDGTAIEYVKDPDHALQVLAIQDAEANAGLISNPTYEMVSMLIAKNPYAIEWIKHPHRDHQEYVLKERPDDGIHYLQEIDEDIAIRHIQANPEQIELMVHQTEECCWAALNEDGSLIKKIRNPTPEMVSYAKLVSDGN